ncbi:MAG: response regulator transcription factor, partial [Bacteroidota bacterium]
LRDNLEFEGYEVSEAEDGQQALEKLKKVTPSLIILDVMMPRLSGFDVCKQLRKGGNETPVILLTAKGEEIDKVLGLELGADDYVQKPFSVRELIARVKAILRRSNHDASKEETVTLGNLTVDFKKLLAYKFGEEKKLSHKEFEILHYLLDHEGDIVDRYELLKNVWGYHEQPTTRTVDNFIARLRQKVELDPSKPKHIITVHGSGYKLIL